MKHVISLRVDVRLVVADDEARICWQLLFARWPQWNLPGRVYLAALDGLRWIGGWIPNRETWRVVFSGGEYWRLMI